MIVYVPVYKNGKKTVETLKTDEIANITKKNIARKKPGVGFYGPCYNDQLFLSGTDAWKYWSREPVRSYTLEEVKSL